MKNSLFILAIAFLSIFIFGCKKDKPPKTPVTLIDGEENKEAYNEFLKTNLATILNDETALENNFVYSPFSYRRALESLTLVTDDFNDSPYFGEKLLKDVDGNNFKSKTEVILNKDMFNIKNKVDEFVLKDFPSGAENESKKIQKEVLGETILKPSYESENAMVVINATAFQGKWEKAFKKSRTYKDNFTTISGDVVEKDFMQGNIDNVVLQNELVDIGRKSMETPGDYAYLVYVKNPTAENILKVARELPGYIQSMENLSTSFGVGERGTVFLAVPKCDIKTNVDILELEKKGVNKELFEKTIDTNENLERLNDYPIFISGIKQAASFKMDENKIVAKAATEIKKDTMMAPVDEPLEIILDSPHFIVTTTNGVITFVALVVK